MIPWLPPGPPYHFPDIEQALDEPDGLLCAGGDLNPERLVQAYWHGIFPWFEDDQPILWWSPAERCVLWPEKLHISKSLKKRLRRGELQTTINYAFERVIGACASPRAYAERTWITQDMQQAYMRLHHLGLAHSVEVWREGELVGGLYGVQIDDVFFGESMFSRCTDASKVALVHLAQQNTLRLIDCQMVTPHLLSMGAEPMPRREFAKMLATLRTNGGQF